MAGAKRAPALELEDAGAMPKMPLFAELEDNVTRVLATAAFLNVESQPPLEVAEGACQSPYNAQLFKEGTQGAACTSAASTSS